MRIVLPLAAILLSACVTPPVATEAPPEEEVALAISKETGKKPLFGGLFARRNADAADPIKPLSEVSTGIEDDDMPVQTALVEAPEAEPGEPGQKRGLFGLFRGSKRDAPASEDTPLDTLALPDEPALVTVDEPIGGGPAAAPVSVTPGFGSLQKACEAKRRSFGKEIEKWPENGKAAFRLFDSDPRSLEVRDFYITGFSDGCARRFRASIAFFGAPSTYETVRYDPLNKDIPKSATDKAYEKIKRKICGKGAGKPCGEGRIGKLEANTVFVTAYDSFGSTTRWAEMLLHDKKVEEVSVKSR